MGGGSAPQNWGAPPYSKGGPAPMARVGGTGTSPLRPKWVRAREHPDPVSQPAKPLPRLDFWGLCPYLYPENPSCAVPREVLNCPGMSGEIRFVLFQRHPGMNPDGAYKQVWCWWHPESPNWGSWSSLPRPGTLQPQTGAPHSSLSRPGTLKSQTGVPHSTLPSTLQPQTGVLHDPHFHPDPEPHGDPW